MIDYKTIATEIMLKKYAQEKVKIQAGGVSLIADYLSYKDKAAFLEIVKANPKDWVIICYLYDQDDPDFYNPEEHVVELCKYHGRCHHGCCDCGRVH